jgi:phosphate transport system substrate-binding protein
LEEVWLSSDGLAVAAHPSVGIDGLSTERLRAVYRGEYTDWSGLGGPESPLVVLDRNEEESAKVIFREHLIGALEVTDTAVSLYYESDMVEALKSTPGAIGYFSYGYGVSRGIAVDYLAIDGVQPSVRTIEDGSYGAIRPLGVVVDPTGDSHATVEAFLEWAAGPEAGSIMREQGYAPYGG